LLYLLSSPFSKINKILFFKTLLQEQVPFYLIFSIWKDKRNYNKKKGSSVPVTFSDEQ